MPLLSLPRRLTTNNCRSLKSPMLALNQPTKWSNVTPDMENTWPVVSCTEVMLSPRMSTPLLLQSRPRDPSNLLTGVQLVSRLVLTTNPQPLYQEAILPRSNVPSACCPTPLLSLKLGLVLIISLILCTPSVHLFTGTLEKAWKKENFPKLVKIWLLLKRITKKLELIPMILKEVTTKENINLLLTYHARRK